MTKWQYFFVVFELYEIFASTNNQIEEKIIKRHFKMDRKPIPYEALDSSILTNGMRVMVDGVDISQFLKNPVMLFDHNDWQLPIGRWLDTIKDSGKILTNAEFDYEDKDEQTQRIIGKAERGFLKACTVGLADIEATDDPMYMLPGQTGPTIIRCRLREISITPIGRNHNALRLYDKDGNEMPFDEKTDTKLLLSDFIVSPKIEIKMSKTYLDLLNLSDKATEAEKVEKIELLLSDKKKATEDLEAEKLKVNSLTNEKTELQSRIDAIELADKTAKKTAFDAELTEAFKDGRLSEKPEGDKLTPVKDRMLNLFDKDPEGTMLLVKDLPKHESSIDLSDHVPAEGESAWDKRQKEIEEANKKK